MYDWTPWVVQHRQAMEYLALVLRILQTHMCNGSYLKPWFVYLYALLISNFAGILKNPTYCPVASFLNLYVNTSSRPVIAKSWAWAGGAAMYTCKLSDDPLKYGRHGRILLNPPLSLTISTCKTKLCVCARAVNVPNWHILLSCWRLDLTKPHACDVHNILCVYVCAVLKNYFNHNITHCYSFPGMEQHLFTPCTKGKIYTGNRCTVPTCPNPVTNSSCTHADRICYNAVSLVHYCGCPPGTRQEGLKCSKYFSSNGWQPCLYHMLQDAFSFLCKCWTLSTNLTCDQHFQG